MRPSIHPAFDLTGLPAAIDHDIRKLVDNAMQSLTGKVSEALVVYQRALDEERNGLAAEEHELQKDNADLIKKNEANAELETLVKGKKAGRCS